MSRQIVLRRQPLLPNQKPTTNQKMRFGEVAGGATAECAAVCCCCPCGLVNLLVLAMYKVPAGLCRKALRRKKEQNLNNGLLPRNPRCTCGGCEETQAPVHKSVSVDLRPLDKSDEDDPTEKKVLELEKEMWDRFYGSGFWRSPSQASQADNRDVRVKVKARGLSVKGAKVARRNRGSIEAYMPHLLIRY